MAYLVFAQLSIELQSVAKSLFAFKLIVKYTNPTIIALLSAWQTIEGGWL